ncbi:hypothetical protein RUND412_005472 [Rhizina undulata]
MRFSTLLSILPLISVSLASALPPPDAVGACPKAPFHININPGSSGKKLNGRQVDVDITNYVGDLVGPNTIVSDLGRRSTHVFTVVDDRANVIPLDHLDLHWDENSKHMYYIHNGQKKWAYIEKSGALAFAGKVPDGCRFWEFSCSSYDGYLYPGGGSKNWSACKAGDHWQLYDPKRAPASCKGANLLSVKISIKVDL